MRCGQFESRLNDLLDRRREPARDRLLSDHAANCERCRGLMSAYARALEGAYVLPLPECRANLAQTVVAEVERPVGSRRLMWRWAAGLSTAAALFVAVSWTRPPLPPVRVNVVVNSAPANPASVAPATLAAASPRLAVGALARQATAKYVDLAQQTRASWSDMLLLMPGSEPEEASGAVELEPGTQVASTFKPLTDSTVDAMGFLLDVLPTGDTRNGSSLDSGNLE